MRSRQGDLGRVIRAARDARDLTRAGLAHAVGIATGYLAAVETDLRTPSVAVLERLARELDLDLDSLLLIRGRLSPRLHRVLREETALAIVRTLGLLSASKRDEVLRFARDLKGKKHRMTVRRRS